MQIPPFSTIRENSLNFISLSALVFAMLLVYILNPNDVGIPFFPNI